jgi:hypothetical protein
MSTQLILYPQNYKGYSSTTTSYQFLVDGINFTSINGSAAITNSGTPTDVITAQPPDIVNTWYRARADAAIAYPTENNGNLLLNSVSSGKYTSTIYQRLDNLTVGQAYTVLVNIVLNTSGSGVMAVLNGTTLVAIQSATTIFGYNITQIGVNFTAQTTTDVFWLAWDDDTNNNLVINDISVTTAVVSPSAVYTDLQDGQVICDLYQEEDIPLTLSIDDFKNVAEQVKSYSKDFNLPATKRNNRIFNNMFEITRADNGLIFNAYVRTQCVLKQDGFILFKGYLKMIDIKDKNGEISYNVNLYSEIISLADTLKDLTFRDLWFGELEHVYSFANIKKSWDDSVGLELANPLLTSYLAYDAALGVDNTNVLKYPLIDWSHNMTYDSSNNPVIETLESNFRPCIQVKYLIGKIFRSTNEFTFTSNFFDTTDFKKLYMDFNWGGRKVPQGIQNNGEGLYEAEGATDNYATSSWVICLLTEDNFPDAQGYELNDTGVFEIPAGQEGTAFEVEYSTTFLCGLDTIFKTRWVYTPAATGLPEYIDESAFTTIQGSATANAVMDCDLMGNYGYYHASVGSVTIVDAGYYGSIPTVEFIDPPEDTGSTHAATGTAVLTGTEVTSITMDAGVGAHNWGYTDAQAGCGGPFNPGTVLPANSRPPRIEFNEVNPFYTISGNFSISNMQPGDKLHFEMYADTPNAIRQSNRFNYKSYPQYTSSVKVSSTVDVVFPIQILNGVRGDLGQWDFLKGIMTMFNLVSMVDEDNPNNILIEPYADVFIDNTRSNDLNDLSLSSRFNGKIHDWTDKVDVSQMELKPLTDLNKETIFQFEEDEDDYAFSVYKASATSGEKLYGSFLWNADAFTVLEGKTEIIASPFAATVVKPLMDIYTDFIIPSIYTYDDGESEGFDNLPRILYDAGIKTLSSCTYYVPEHPSGAAYPTQDTFLQFSHLSEEPITISTIDFVFKSGQLVAPLGINGSPIENLFHVYWLPYFAELYHSDTRTVTLKVALNASDIATFKFYDKVMIKNRTFRVNKIEYKPNSLAKVEFILIP